MREEEKEEREGEGRPPKASAGNTTGVEERTENGPEGKWSSGTDWRSWRAGGWAASKWMDL